MLTKFIIILITNPHLSYRYIYTYICIYINYINRWNTKWYKLRFGVKKKFEILNKLRNKSFGLIIYNGLEIKINLTLC